MRLDTALWRAVAVYRLAALLYAAGSVAAHLSGYARPHLALAVLAGMAVWSAVTVVGHTRPGRGGWALPVVDLVVTVAAQLSSLLVLTPEAIDRGDPTLTVSWAACPVLVWAVRGGAPAGALAAAVVSAGAVVERGDVTQATANSVVLLMLAGLVGGHVVSLARRAEQAYAEAVELRAAATERERLARSVHDGVLQTLTLVGRGSHDPALAALAVEQEGALRRLLAGPAAAAPGGGLDVTALLPAGPDVELAAPAGPVLLPSGPARELADAVGAAVDNALRHGGGHAWLLVEDEADAVTVTVRDAGPGLPPGRVEQAEREGRLGLARCVRGRVEDLGGTMTLTSAPGHGTEVELRVPRT